MRKVMSLLMIYIIAVMLVGCQSQSQREEEERRQMEANIRHQGRYAFTMSFENHLFWDGMRWSHFYISLYDREVIFVTSEEAAAELGFPIDVIIGFPSVFSLGFMEGINNAEDELATRLKENDLSFESFGLSFPLTVEDLVYNWEAVDSFLLDISIADILAPINTQARNDYRQALNTNRTIRRWLFPGRLDELNRLLEGREISEETLIQVYERIKATNENATMDDVPTFPITEEDVRNNPSAIWNIVSLVLEEEERRIFNSTPETLQRWFMEAQEGEQE